MIYRDIVHVHLEMATDENDAHGNPITITVDRDVNGVVTFLDSESVFDPGGNRISSRLRLIISPFDHVLPPDPTKVAAVYFGWTPYGDTDLLPDGAIEHHFLGGRLHHYEVICKAT
ncbi:hypothetical protein [Tomitella fengzijianii]|uniref:hypothetical protein n=1 Tax=Tomitella fengzijianii TaxID=2597660 RepID=UPI00131B5432|nr:hypothetical protein [Tomitella fengzijianii]